ncbi:MAG: hypothetical protein ACQESR_17295 [Planctomycetota bacterium]
MANEPVSQVRLVLGNHEGMGRITVELEPFFEFSFWMAEELQDLVAANKHFAQPPESRQPRALRRVD